MGGVYVRPLRRVYTNIPTTICESLTEKEGDRRRSRKNGECTPMFLINDGYELMKRFAVLTHIPEEARKTKNK